MSRATLAEEASGSGEQRGQCCRETETHMFGAAPPASRLLPIKLKVLQDDGVFPRAQTPSEGVPKVSRDTVVADAVADIMTEQE